MISLVLLTLFLLVVLIKFPHYYTNSYIGQTIYTAIWFISDSSLYAKVLLASSFACTLQAFISTSLNSLFPVSQQASSSTDEETSASILNIPKRFHKFLLYLNLRGYIPTLSTFKLFENSSESSNNWPLFKAVFSAANKLKQIEESKLMVASPTVELLNAKSVSLDSLTKSDIKSIYISQVLDQTLLNQSDLSDHSAPQINSELGHWTLNHIAISTSLNKSLPVSTHGSFSLTNVSTSEINSISQSVPELTPLRASINSKLDVIRWQRWLYKYNILHRSALTNTNYITSVKQLLGAGFYDSQLTERNIWSSSSFLPSAQKHGELSNLYRALYRGNAPASNSTLAEVSAHPFFLNSSALNTLSFYEESYHWYLKRFYSLNTLASNSAVLSPMPQTSSKNYSPESLLSMQNSLIGFHIALSNSPQSSYSTLDSVVETSSQSISYTPSTEVLNYSESDLFPKNRLDVMSNLLKNNTSKSSTFFKPR